MKAIFSKKSLNDTEDKCIKQYIECVKDIFYTDEVKAMAGFHQHCNTSRLQHSFNVSYYSFILAKKLKLDYRAAARAGLLHDLYLYD